MSRHGGRAERRAAFVVATLTSFLGPFMSSSVNVALPSIGTDLGIGAVALAWVNLGFLLAAAAPLIPFGRLADLHGRKRVFCVGIAIFTIGSALVAMAGSGGQVITWRALQGVGASMVFATGLPILVSAFPADRRGAVIGINVAAVYLGLSVGPFAGGLVTEQLGWRALFWLNVPLGLAIFLVAFQMLPSGRPPATDQRFDRAGSLLLVASLVLAMMGLPRLPSAAGTILLASGLAGLVLFVRYEAGAAHPVLEVTLFRHNRTFVFSSLAALIHYGATFAVSFLMSLYLQKVSALSPQEAGLVLIAQPVAQTLVSPIAGRLSDRLEPRTVASVGMAITLAGLVLLAAVEAGASLPALIGCLLVLGLGFGIFSSPNTNAIMGSVAPRVYGVAAAMVGTMRQLGMMISMGVVLTVLAATIGSAEIEAVSPEALHHAARVSFALFAVLCLGGIFASLARGTVDPGADRAGESGS